MDKKSQSKLNKLKLFSQNKDLANFDTIQDIAFSIEKTNELLKVIAEKEQVKEKEIEVTIKLNLI